jgi:thiol:disulfide interchange protein DsbC
MTFPRLPTLLLGLFLPVLPAVAGDELSAEALDALRDTLEAPGGLEVDSARESEVPGLLEVQFRDGPTVYATPDGAFFILGDLYQVGVDGYVNLAEKRRDGARREALAAVEEDETIIFPAEGETRGHISVFTDVTCFYCQKLHREVPELNRRGIEVRYFAYPRSGVGSEGFRLLATAWCADDRQAMLTRLKAREEVEANVCAGNPVAAQYALGQEVGVRGTPAIITPDGQMIPGYRPAEDLISALGLD